MVPVLGRGADAGSNAAGQRATALRWPAACSASSLQVTSTANITSAVLFSGPSPTTLAATALSCTGSGTTCTSTAGQVAAINANDYLAISVQGANNTTVFTSFICQ